LRDWHITDDKTAVQILVQKVECKKCHHYQLLEPAKAKDIFDNWESYRCELCYNDTGRLKINHFDVCGNCNQVMDSKRICFCPVKENEFKTKIIIDPKGVWTKKKTMSDMEREIENDKSQRLLVNKKNQALKDEHQRQVQQADDMHYLRVKAELDQAKGDLQKEAKPKEYSGSAII